MTIFETFTTLFKEELNRLEKGKKTEQWALDAINSLGEMMNAMEKDINDYKIRDMNDSIKKKFMSGEEPKTELDILQADLKFQLGALEDLNWDLFVETAIKAQNAANKEGRNILQS